MAGGRFFFDFEAFRTASGPSRRGRVDGVVTGPRLHETVDAMPHRCSAQVFVLLILIGFREEVQMTKLYNIKNNDMLYFLLFSVVLIPFQFIADVFTLSALTQRPMLFNFST